MNVSLGIPFDEVANDFTPLIFGMLKRLNIHKNKEEYTQIGFIALWKAYDMYDKKKGAFSTLAYSYVRGDMLAHLRKEARYGERFELSSFETEQEAAPASESPTISQEINSILPYLKNLSARERVWVVEHTVYGKGISEIAAQYGVADSTVKSWRKTALQKLRESAQLFE
ncbi:sigma-70 family RNA polymerase sigma factor [Alteribacillus sp. HJP-4]|uniref:sigma-70 family RNA polymerase sigma factor n=1 Tax=Alteribacillus sp. HJP-4 TaxID=2775394 RepID=UPI0035CCDE1B